MEKKDMNILDHLAEELVPNDIDLWPAIQNYFELNKEFSSQEDIIIKSDDQKKHDHQAKTNEKSRWSRILVISALSLLMLVVLFFSTPQGRSFAQEFFRFYRHAESDSFSREVFEATLPEKTPTPTPTEIVFGDIAIEETPIPTPTDYKYAGYTIEETEQMAGFSLLQPTWLPDTLKFKGASYNPETQEVTMLYKVVPSWGANGLAIIQKQGPFDFSCLLCSKVGSSTPIEVVQIGSITGEYVIGGWILTSDGPYWDPDDSFKRLRLMIDDMAIRLVFMGDPRGMTKETLIAIAASMEYGR
jgi:hypothetical protein